MKKLLIIPLACLSLMACETIEVNEQNEERHERAVQDTQAITQQEKHQMEMEADEAAGYPQEKGLSGAVRAL
jgi:outer membrane biogenesis lipoprotein LolB